MRLLALGDSYTIGEGVAPPDAWPAQLAAKLRAERMDVGDATVVATTGWTADELARAVDARALRGPFELVTLQIGVNDQYRGHSPLAFAPAFVSLLERALRFAAHDPERVTSYAAGGVVVVSIPDWGVTPFNTASAAPHDTAQVAREIDAFNAVCEREARQHGAAWVDITDLSRAAPADVTADGLHPSPAMYARWVERILPVARAVLQDASADT